MAAQIPVGFYFDINGTEIPGFYEPIYSLQGNRVLLNYYAHDFTAGVFYRKDGSRSEAFLRLQGPRVLYKLNPGDKKSEMISIDLLKGLTINRDTFFIAENFNLEKPTGPVFRTRRELMEFILETEDLTFARHHNFKYGLQLHPQNQPYTKLLESYQVKSKKEENWTSFPKDNKGFRRVALQYFSEIPGMREKLLEGRYKHDDVYRLIKSLQFYHLSVKGSPAYMDMHMNEVNKVEAYYRLKIALTANHNWKINYFLQGNLVYSATYSDIFPFVKDGVFKSYYANGAVREERIYKDDQLMVCTRKNPKGMVINTKTRNTEEDLSLEEMRYYQYLNGTESDLLENKTDAVIAVNDRISGRDLNLVIEDRKLKYTWYEEAGKRIYQPVSEQLYAFKLHPFQQRFYLYVNDRELRKAYYSGQTGTTLIRLKIDKRGVITDYSLLNSISPALDREIYGILKYTISERGEDEVKPLRIDGKKVDFELVVPLTFGIKKYYVVNTTFVKDNFRQY